MPTTADRKATLEAIAFGDDPHVRPSDRLKALEMLGEETGSDECWRCRLRDEQEAEAERREREDPEWGMRLGAEIVELGGIPLLMQTLGAHELEGTPAG